MWRRSTTTSPQTRLPGGCPGGTRIPTRPHGRGPIRGYTGTSTHPWPNCWRTSYVSMFEVEDFVRLMVGEAIRAEETARAVGVDLFTSFESAIEDWITRAPPRSDRARRPGAGGPLLSAMVVGIFVQHAAGAIAEESGRSHRPVPRRSREAADPRPRPSPPPLWGGRPGAPPGPVALHVVGARRTLSPCQPPRPDLHRRPSLPPCSRCPPDGVALPPRLRQPARRTTPTSAVSTRCTTAPPATSAARSARAPATSSVWPTLGTGHAATDRVLDHRGR